MKILIVPCGLRQEYENQNMKQMFNKNLEKNRRLSSLVKKLQTKLRALIWEVSEL